MSGGTPLGRMMIELGLDDTAFGKGVDGAKKKVTYLSKEMQANMKIADLAGDKYGKLGVKFDGLTGIISAQQQKVEQLKKSYEGSLVDGKPTEQTAKLATQLQQANGQLASYNKQLANTAGDMAKWKIENEGVTGGLMTFGKGLETVGGQMSTVGDKMTKGVTLPIVAGVGLVTKAAIDWESAFTGVKKTVDEVVDANGKVVYSYDDLEASLRGLTKVLPATHGEIAAVAEAAGQLGIETKNVTSFTKTMIDLGESTSMSSEEAATALARLANITGLPQTEFDRLGSSIVELGNNFATTESEITAMAMRLAGAGSIVGMSEADIMGLSAALSSVGIEAESGGSSISKLMINMELASTKGVDAFQGLQEVAERNGIAWDQVSAAVNNGGKELKEMSNALGLGNKGLSELYKNAEDNKQALEDFAYVAGMTGDEFAQAFEKDAVGAIGKFVEGLAHAEEKGTTAIEMLDDMGVSEVRLRDALLRAGGASELFGDAIATSNKAFKENTALSEEAEKRYGTMESQLKFLKNEINDVAIDLGGPFVEAMREGLQAAKPMLESISGLAKEFSNADPKTQQMIMKLIAFTAVAGPTLSVLGRLSTGIGGMTTKTISFLGEMSKKSTVKAFSKELVSGTADMTKWGEVVWDASKSTAKFGTAAVETGVTTGSLAAMFGKATTSVAGLSGGIGLLTSPLGIATGLTIAAVAGWKLYGETAVEASQRTKTWGADVDEETGTALEKFQGFSVGTTTALENANKGLAASSEGIKTTFSEMYADIEKSADDANQEIVKTINKLPDELKSSAAAALQAQKESNEKSKEIAKQASESTLEIIKRHNGDIRQLSDDEKKIILDNQRTLNAEKVRILNLSADEEKQVLAALNGDIEDMSDKQRVKAIENIVKMNRERSAELISGNAKMKELLGEDSKEYGDYIQEVEAQQKMSTESMARNVVRLAQANGLSYDQIKVELGKLGIDYREKARIIEEANEEMKGSTSILADSFGNLSQETIQANEMWKGLVFDPKNGEVKTNAQEEVTKAIGTQEGWENIEYIMKNANLNSNAKEVIMAAIVESGVWEQYEIDPKMLKGDNLDLLMSLLESEGALASFNKMSPELKNLFADDSGSTPTVEQAEKAIRDFNELPIPLRKLLTDNSDAMTKVNDAQNVINTFNLTQVPGKTIDVRADTSGANIAQNAIDGIPNNTDKTVTVTHRTVYVEEDYRNAPPGSMVATYATGTNFHSGGLATINDQRGSLYKELVERPNGQLFTVEGRNVTLPLERGAKVYTAAQSKNLIPHYENGVGVPKNAKVMQTMDWLNKATSSSQNINMKLDNSGMIKELQDMKKILFGILNKDTVINIPNQNKSTRDMSASLAFENEINRRGNLQ